MMKPSDNRDEPGTVEKSDPVASRSERNVTVIGDRIDSRDLFAGVREIIIGHGSEMYRLRLTAQNKLILTK
jgi:hemin uptake protein HemP